MATTENNGHSRSERFRILFVCMGNICRSPAAEGVMKQIAEAEGLAGLLEIDSAGTIDYHEGNPADPRMREAALGRGVALTSRARQIRSRDLGQFDLILAMDDENLADIRRLDPEGRYQNRIRRFCDFTRETSARTVPDPYYGNDDGFDRVLDILEDGCTGLIEHIQDHVLNTSP